MLKIKRVYEAPAKDDGYRVLVDRLWPRGVGKAKAALDLWLKDVAPSTELRTWFNHDPAKFNKFKVRYEHELKDNPATKELEDLVKKHPTVTLVFSAKDAQISQAVVLQAYLRQKLKI